MATKKNEKSSSEQDTSRDDALLNAPFHDLDSFEIETLLEEVNVLDLEGYLFTFDPKNKGVRTGLHKIDVAGTKTGDVRMNLLPKRRLQSSFFFLVALFTFYDLPVAIAQEGEPSLSVSQQEIAELKELLALAKQERIDAAVEGNKTGNDPRDFSLKWTPFYRYTKLENGLTQQDLTAFGTVPFSRRLGVLFEVPVAQYRDFSDVPGFLPGTDAIGIGDISLKFVHNPEALGFTYGKDGEKSGSILLGADFVLPTATDDALAGDALL